jgi:hypothetical protein
MFSTWIFQLAISTDQVEPQFAKVPKAAIQSFFLPMITHHLPKYMWSIERKKGIVICLTYLQSIHCTYLFNNFFNLTTTNFLFKFFNI